MGQRNVMRPVRIRLSARIMLTCLHRQRRRHTVPLRAKERLSDWHWLAFENGVWGFNGNKQASAWLGFAHFAYSALKYWHFN